MSADRRATTADPVAAAVMAILGEDEPADWRDSALCAQTDPDEFFPEKGGSTRDAKKVCRSCDVRTECLEYALETDQKHGIWGGLSERERRRLRRGEIAPVVIISEKTCTKCRTPKPFSEFSRRGGTSSGLEHQCKMCRSDARRAARETRAA
jgi:WhiB family redox-sensing transcriptional regulator